jgi:hypothetical protein
MEIFEQIVFFQGCAFKYKLVLECSRINYYYSRTLEMIFSKNLVTAQESWNTRQRYYTSTLTLCNNLEV